MNTWQRWVKRPQSLWPRKALFQVHLWSGIGLGVYVIVVCLSGSAAVFNSELYTKFLPKPMFVTVAGTRMTRPELKQWAQRSYPGSIIGRISLPRNPAEAAVVSLGTGVNADQRFVDPYVGRDLGSARPFGLKMVSYFSQLHMTLLMGYTGRIINGVGGFLVTILSITGMIIWWPGIRRWRRSLIVRRDTNFKRFNWDLHSAIGFWTFALVVMWSLTGAYLVFPKLFVNAINYIYPSGQTPDLNRIIHPLHVGDFAGWPVKALWAILGFAPPALFVTGAIMWWFRVLKPWLRRRSAAESLSGAPHPRVPGRILEADEIGQV